MAEQRNLLSTQEIRQTRDRMPQLRRVARTEDERDGVELFGALCEYLDQLSGETDVDRLLDPDHRARLTAAITAVSSAGPGPGADDHDQPDPDVVRRLAQPVNAAVTLAEGRDLAARLIETGEWQAALGRSLQSLYGYLDQLHGGRFTELINSRERRAVAELFTQKIARPGVSATPPGSAAPGPPS